MVTPAIEEPCPCRSGAAVKSGSVSHSSESPMSCARVRGLAEPITFSQNLPPKPKHPDFFRRQRPLAPSPRSKLACLLPTQLHNTKHVRKQRLSGKVEGDGPRPNASAGAGTPTTWPTSTFRFIAEPRRGSGAQVDVPVLRESIAESASRALYKTCFCLRRLQRYTHLTKSYSPSEPLAF